MSGFFLAVMLFVADVVNDKNAVREARNLGIPVVGIVDTNADPTDIDFVIPANDDAISGVQTIVGYTVEAVKEGIAKSENK